MNVNVNVKYLVPLLALAGLFLAAGCNALSRNVPPASARAPEPIELVTENPAGATYAPARVVDEPSFGTPDSGTASPKPSRTPPGTTAAAITLTPTATASPTASNTPAPLPLRDDLPALTLQEFPRPQNDNGLCIHFTPTGYYKPDELDKQIARMQAMHLKWALALYADENQLEMAAQKFHDAGITVVWRKTLHPYQKYFGWGRDVEVLNKIGMPPYLQMYNEPELPVEWDEHPEDLDLYFANLLQATKDIYNAGGYPGLQVLDEDYLRRFIDEVYARKGEAIFHRMIFVAHAPGLNHPPDYVEDMNGVLGFRAYATIFFKRLGFVPPIVAGEGGYKIDSQEDNRFPPIDDKLHRDYNLAVFNWFRTGTLSNGGKLPDYLFAFCPWLLAANDEAGAWFDSFRGERTQTIEAVQQLPIFIRKFSWDQ